MTQINAYLTFKGNCREGMTFYRECLGGELDFMTVGETPVADQMPHMAPESIMHSSLTNGTLMLSASDMGCNGEDESATTLANSVSLLVQCESEAQINDLYQKLSSGGEILCPLGEQFWGDTFASFTDKFGFGWNLNLQKAATA